MVHPTSSFRNQRNNEAASFFRPCGTIPGKYVPPWFGTQQEARIRPLPKRSQQKKNEPVQFFQRSLQEVEAHSPSGQSRPLPGITQIHERS